MKNTTVILEAGKPARILCGECNQEFELPPFAIAAQFARFCPGCSDKKAMEDQAEYIANAANRKNTAWDELCPPDFRDTDPSKLPSPSKLDKVLQWSYGKQGLILGGATRKGKSRCAWLLIRREFRAGRRCHAIGGGFAFDYSSMFRDGAWRASEWVNKLANCELLLLDDVFKVRLTDSVEQALFHIVNHRMEYCLPLIVTCNDTGETLKTRLSEDRGDPLIARLQESCRWISF